MCQTTEKQINSLNTVLNPIFHLLALLGAHHILHVSIVRVKDEVCMYVCVCVCVCARWLKIKFNSTQFSSSLLICWHSSQKANYRDTTHREENRQNNQNTNVKLHFFITDSQVQIFCWHLIVIVGRCLDPSKHQELLTQKHTVTTQNASGTT